MRSPKKHIVLYFPQQVDPAHGVRASMDLLPLSLLTIAAWPERDGHPIVLIDGNLMDAREAERRVLAACEGALLFGTTGILGYQVLDGHRRARAVRERFPRLPLVVGGWFASSAPQIALSSGVYDVVCIGQGELTFRELVQALDAGEPLERVAGLAFLREGALVRTPHRPVVGWSELLDCPWHLLDIEPYRAAQLASRPAREVEAMVIPPGREQQPSFGISYYSSFGCPEPCAFCCSPQVSDLRWKAMPAGRLLDDLCGLQDRWGFETVRFHDANFGVLEKRVRELAEGLLARGRRIAWYPLMQSSSVARYDPRTLEAMRESGMYVAQLGGETGDEATMREVGKHTRPGINAAAAERLQRLGVRSLITYIIGYPGESSASMLATLDEARRIAASCPLARPNVWPYQPIPGTGFYPRAVAAGFRPPDTLEEWGTHDEYKLGLEHWPGQLPREVARRRALYDHFYTLALGLPRGRIGWWERRARRRMACGDFRGGRLEAKAYDVLLRMGRRFRPQPRHQVRVPAALEPMVSVG